MLYFYIIYLAQMDSYLYLFQIKCDGGKQKTG